MLQQMNNITCDIYIYIFFEEAKMEYNIKLNWGIIS